MADGGSDSDSGLPSAAQARMAEIQSSGTWGSSLSTSEFAAIRSTGFEPVGQVLGAAVYNVGYTGGFGCPGAWSGLGRYGVPAVGVTTVSGDGNFASFRPMVATLYEARRAAISRMTAECTGLGGHGIVGVSLSFGPFPQGGLEFRAIGTAVRGMGAPAPPQPFSSDLSGQDFAKLIRAGWVPVALLQGVGVTVRHNDWSQRIQSLSWANQELVGATALIQGARSVARTGLARDAARVGAHTVVLRDLMSRMYERRSTDGPSSTSDG